MDHATVLAAATHASASSQVESGAIFAAFLACFALFLARAWRRRRRERSRQEAWRTTALAAERARLAAAVGQRRAFQAARRGCRPSRDDAIVLDQYRADIGVYRANVRDLKNWPR